MSDTPILAMTALTLRVAGVATLLLRDGRDGVWSPDGSTIAFVRVVTVDE